MRAHWSLDPAVIHLNHGSYGAVPRVTQDLQQQLREQAERNPMQWFRDRPDRVLGTRETIAAYLHTGPENIALLANASAGVTVALRAVRAKPGQRFVVTDHAYGAVRFAVERIARRRGCEVVEADIPLDASDDDVVGLLGQHIDERAAVVVIDAITSATAKVMPAARIAELGRARGVPVVVDGAHAPGLVDHPVTGDFWTGSLHKWPCAPRGTGVLYVDPAQQPYAVSPAVSWNEPLGFPAAFDLQGTMDDTGWLAATRSLDLLHELEFRDRLPELSDLVDRGAAEVADAIGEQVLDVGTPAPTMRLMSFPGGPIKDTAAADRVQGMLAARTGVEVSVPSWRSRGLLRLSAHLYNEPADYTEAARRLEPVFADLPRQLSQAD